MTIVYHNFSLYSVVTSEVSALSCFVLHQTLAGGRTSLTLTLANVVTLLCFVAENPLIYCFKELQIF